jgi:hypothetical protein
LPVASEEGRPNRGSRYNGKGQILAMHQAYNREVDGQKAMGGPYT